MTGTAKKAIVDLCAAAGAIRSRLSSGKRALVIPPAGPGSVGDAAMLTSIIATLRKNGYSRVDLLQVEKGCHWPLDAREDRLIPAADFIDYGSRMNLAAILLQLGGYSDLLCVGADILDGIYDEDKMTHRLELLARAARMGVRATVVGSSFSDHPSPQIVSLLRSLPAGVRIFARDEYSHERMKRALGRDIGLSADTAFLLPAAEERLAGHGVLTWVERQKGEGRKIVAVNANNLHEKGHPTLVEDYARMAAKLIEVGASVLLIPHDSRMARSDQFIAGEILALLGEGRDSHAFRFEAETPGQLKALLSRADLAVTGRMHAAIIASGAHTPAMSFAYANKFEGFYRHLDLDPAEMILTLDALRDEPDRVVSRILAVLKKSEQLSTHIAGRLGAIEREALRNFDFAAPGEMPAANGRKKKTQGYSEPQGTVSGS
ncbi:polysaccharide pyruvyl transferase family protein [Alteraurantiacibacter aquimixticola]|uniref:Polysaccharide pyruvyl transferase domain-containing protein n=1 Tax=Alteraurantiacibacter aquimixticola TaxID=2489173 RepID=A0A4T3F484_9SPHN|nr:polysaccharide pyruvyl transferase family protein [Alteraurantiacibacter aquimixticola]TIX51249.1 hypothetical protein E5222_01920 [Alteraurantiacibacter aquimixticola]